MQHGEGLNGLTEASDGILAERVADGDVRAFEVLVRRYGPMMRVYAAKMLRSDVESDDVVQEALLTAWNRIEQLSDVTSVKTWLMRIVTNKAIDRMRRRKDQVDIDDYDAPVRESERPDHVVETRREVQALSTSLANLPEMQRRCWLMREVGDASYAEIADALDVPQSTVRGQLARARQTLVREMAAWQ